jgi:hypothetical protein
VPLFLVSNYSTPPIIIVLGGRFKQCKRNGKKPKPAAHAAFINVPLALFFFSSARTNLSQRAMPARFSGM